jgi:hypothetical protein
VLVLLLFVLCLSLVENSWTPKQILSMQKGGNATFNDFLKSYGVDPRMDIQQKYHTSAALLYKERLLAFVEGREPPTELPQVQQMPANNMGSVPEGSQRLPGETDEQYIRRQTILREQAKERMRQKFGSSGRMQGIGSDASYNASAGGYGRGGATGGGDEFAKAGEFLQESLAFFGQQLKKASEAAQQTAQSLQQQEFTRQMKESWASLQAKVADPTMTEELKKNTAASWETLQNSTASTWSFLSTSATEFFNKAFNEGSTETSSSMSSSTTPQPYNYGGYGDMGYDQGIDDFVSAPASLQPPVHHASHMQRDSPVAHAQSAPVSSTTRVSSAASPAAAAATTTTSQPARSPARASPKAADDDFFGSFGLN